MKFEGRKFTASYSGGKDSILAIYRAVKMGMHPLSLIITYNTDVNRSWFHGIPEELLNDVSNSLGIPVRLIKTSGDEYTVNFEKELRRQKENGAEFCVFGDIDIDGHLEWGTERCENTGLEALFPLWREPRKALVKEFIDSGFKANITGVDMSRLSEKHLGMVLSSEVISSIASEGADECGENGEYHTFVSDGPLFKYPVQFSFGRKIYNNNYALLPLEKSKIMY